MECENQVRTTPGLRLNVKNTKAMLICRKSEEVICYLGSEITRGAGCEKGVMIRIMEAKTRFGQLRKLLSNSKV